MAGAAQEVEDRDNSLSLLLIIEKDGLLPMLRTYFELRGDPEVLGRDEHLQVCLDVETYQTFLNGTRPVILRQLAGDQERMERLLSNLLTGVSIGIEAVRQEMNWNVANSYFTRTVYGEERVRAVSISFQIIHDEVIRRHFQGHTHVRLPNGCVVRAYNHDMETVLPEGALMNDANLIYQREDSRLMPERPMVFEGTVDQVAEALVELSVRMNTIVNDVFNNPIFANHSYFYDLFNMGEIDVMHIPNFNGHILAEGGEELPHVIDHLDFQMAMQAPENAANVHRNEVRPNEDVPNPEIVADVHGDQDPPPQPQLEERAEDEEVQEEGGAKEDNFSSPSTTSNDEQKEEGARKNESEEFHVPGDGSQVEQDKAEDADSLGDESRKSLNKTKKLK